MIIPDGATPTILPPISTDENPTHNRELKVIGAPGQALAWGGVAKGGDDKLTWDSDDEFQVGKARTAFNDYVNRGFKMYKSGTIGGKKVGDPITEFDPNIERMIAVPPLKGG